jgi:DNA-binding LytR/AlgR family response regulator
MLSLPERLPGRERLRLACALAFWVATYLLFVTWNHLQSEFPFAVWQTRRLAATLWGALLFFGFTWLADNTADRTSKDRAVILIGAAAGCGISMILMRAAIDYFIVASLNERMSTWAGHLRFTLIWSGYFAGCVLAFVSFTAPVAKPVELEDTGTAAPESANDTSSYPDALWVSRGRETVRVPTDAIDWIEAEGDYVRLHAQSGGGLLRGTLSGLEARLDPLVFARVHRSAICRRSAIVAMIRKPSGAMAVRLDSGTEVPVGRRYRDAVVDVLAQGGDARSRIRA